MLSGVRHPTYIYCGFLRRTHYIQVSLTRPGTEFKISVSRNLPKISPEQLHMQPGFHPSPQP